MVKETFKGVWLRWPKDRKNRQFTAYVVEPRAYNKKRHRAIFVAALDRLLNVGQVALSDTGGWSDESQPIKFDLLTFPEAFLTRSELVDFLRKIGGNSAIGCVHVGLAGDNSSNHLFSASQLVELVEELKKLPGVCAEDLVAFSSWISLPERTGRYNVACLFTVDNKGETRVCLHPKVIRSKFEVSGLSEKHMEEADFLSLVTLQQEENKLLSVTIQPLICSDGLQATTDKPGMRPMEALTSHPTAFSDGLPDHVDIVSLALCTPQEDEFDTGGGSGASGERVWHQLFRKTFQDAPSDDRFMRHHFSTFIMANFTDIPLANGTKGGGLSGSFIPVPPSSNEYPDYVGSQFWARAGNSKEYGWRRMSAEMLGCLGYIATLRSRFAEKVELASMFGFTIQRLPRDSSQWAPDIGGLAEYRLMRAVEDSEFKISFEERGAAK